MSGISFYYYYFFFFLKWFPLAGLGEQAIPLPFFPHPGHGIFRRGISSSLLFVAPALRGCSTLLLPAAGCHSWEGDAGCKGACGGRGEKMGGEGAPAQWGAGSGERKGAGGERRGAAGPFPSPLRGRAAESGAAPGRGSSWGVAQPVRRVAPEPRLVWAGRSSRRASFPVSLSPPPSFPSLPSPPAVFSPLLSFPGSSERGAEGSPVNAPGAPQPPTPGSPRPRRGGGGRGGRRRGGGGGLRRSRGGTQKKKKRPKNFPSRFPGRTEASRLGGAGSPPAGRRRGMDGAAAAAAGGGGPPEPTPRKGGGGGSSEGSKSQAGSQQPLFAVGFEAGFAQQPQPEVRPRRPAGAGEDGLVGGKGRGRKRREGRGDPAPPPLSLSVRPPPPFSSPPSRSRRTPSRLPPSPSLRISFSFTFACPATF